MINASNIRVKPEPFRSQGTSTVFTRAPHQNGLGRNLDWHRWGAGVGVKWIRYGRANGRAAEYSFP